jgi:hypothetical protein
LSIVVGSSFPSLNTTSTDEMIFLSKTMTSCLRIFWYCVYLYAMDTIPTNPWTTVTIELTITAPVTISSSEWFCVAFSMMGKLFHGETQHSWLPFLYQAKCSIFFFIHSFFIHQWLLF